MIKKQIKASSYSLDWPIQFKNEADNLRKLLGNHCLKLHHIGSTAVPDLYAKSEIDILCVIDDLSHCKKMEGTAYIFKGEYNVPLRYFFSKNSKKIKINLHVVEPNHGFIELNLFFRDYLREHKHAVKAYTELKKKLLSDPTSYFKLKNNFSNYTLGKNQFIKNILSESGINTYCVNFCYHKEEWDAYHQIREAQIFSPIQACYNKEHSANHHHFVLYNGITIVSVAHIEFLNKSEALIRSIATKTPYKNKGHATYLILFLEQWMKRKKIKVIRVHSNIDAARFYTKLKYRNTAFEHIANSEHTIDLVKSLE